MLAAISTAVLVFAATNVDDLVVLTFLFMASQAEGSRGRARIVAGQAVGIAALAASSLVAAFGLLVIPMHWVALLGIVPLALGLWRLVAVIRHGPDDDRRARPTATVGTVALIAIINGADNLAVYTPVFRTEAAGEVFVTLIVFLVMIGAWCVLAAWLAHHLSTVKAIARVSHLAVPLVFIAIGIILLTHLS